MNSDTKISNSHLVDRIAPSLDKLLSIRKLWPHKIAIWRTRPTPDPAAAPSSDKIWCVKSPTMLSQLAYWVINRTPKIL